MGLFIDFLNHVFRSPQFREKHQLWLSSFFWKCCKFNSNFKNIETHLENVFFLWDNCIWIGCFKLFLLRREYLWSAVNMLTNIFKTLHVTNRDFSQLNCLHSDQQIWQKWCRSDFNSVWSPLHVGSRRIIWKGLFIRFD